MICRLALPALLVALAVAACSPAEAGAPAEPALARICAAEHVDATSTIYVGRDAAGAPARYVVTSSTKVMDSPNRIFDVDGNYLGLADRGPLLREDLVPAEPARVAALMDGAKLDPKPLATTCD